MIGRAQTSWTYFPTVIFLNVRYATRPAIMSVYSCRSPPRSVFVAASDWTSGAVRSRFAYRLIQHSLVYSSHSDDLLLVTDLLLSYRTNSIFVTIFRDDGLSTTHISLDQYRGTTLVCNDVGIFSKMCVRVLECLGNL
jgi:hypothetical protein